MAFPDSAGGYLHLTSIVAVAFAFFLFPAVGGTGEPRGLPTQRDSVVVPFYFPPASLNPLKATDTVSSAASELVCSSLVRVGEDARAVPDLAESWQVSADGKVWTFHIRKNVRFHDGTEATADDVLATYRALMDPAGDSAIGGLYTVVERLDAPSRYEFVVHLKNAYAPLLYLMLQGIVPASFLRSGPAGLEALEKHPVGTGPFRFAEWTDTEIRLEAFDGYFGGAPAVRRVTFRRFPDREAAWVSLVRGDIDVTLDVQEEQVRVIAGDDRIATHQMLDPFCYTVLFNTEDPLFASTAIRSAVAKAIDKQDLIDKVLLGRGREATGPFTPGSWASDPAVSAQAYDPAAARKLLAQEGWADTDGDGLLEKAGRDLAFEMAIDEGDALKDALARRLRWQLLRLGIRMDVRVLARTDYFQAALYPGRFQAAILQLNATGDPNSAATAFWDSASIGRSNFSRYRQPSADALIAKGRTTSDEKAREATYRSLHALLAQEAPAAFLFFRIRLVAAASRIVGIPDSLESFWFSMARWRFR
jgi:peptide/nickel transport system substrate-binding protein